MQDTLSSQPDFPRTRSRAYKERLWQPAFRAARFKASARPRTPRARMLLRPLDAVNPTHAAGNTPLAAPPCRPAAAFRAHLCAARAPRRTARCPPSAPEGTRSAAFRASVARLPASRPKSRLLRRDARRHHRLPALAKRPPSRPRRANTPAAPSPCCPPPRAGRSPSRHTAARACCPAPCPPRPAEAHRCVPPCRPPRPRKPRRNRSAFALRRGKVCWRQGGSNPCEPSHGNRAPLSREFPTNTGARGFAPKSRSQPSVWAAVPIEPIIARRNPYEHADEPSADRR